MKKFKLIEHPILQYKLGVLRAQETTPQSFRQIVDEISEYLAYETTHDLKTKEVDIQTPLENCKATAIDEDLILVSILRAGEGMLPAFLRVLPFARVGHIGIYRDKAMNNTVEYYFKLPTVHKGKRTMVLDPLLATADTALAAIDRLKQYEVGPITLVTLLSNKYGIDKVHEFHPDVKIYTVSVERELNEKGYLLPGLGDAGDRLFRSI